MRRARSLCLLALVAALPGCSDFPPLEESVGITGREAPYPDLVPVAELRAAVPAPGIEADTAGGIEARVARLRARAARLRRTVIDSRTEARMRNGVRDI